MMRTEAPLQPSEPLSKNWLTPFLEGMTDGVYRAYVDERGNEVHESVNRAFPDATPAAPISVVQRDEDSLAARDFGQIYCGCGFDLVPGDCDAAVADIKNQLGGGATFSYRAYYSIRGAVVAFACARTYDYTITGDNYASFVSDVTSVCGRYVAGTFADYGQGYLGADVGYMQYYSGLDFCAHAEGSSEHSC